jgi:hypothetical protein
MWIELRFLKPPQKPVYVKVTMRNKKDFVLHPIGLFVYGSLSSTTEGKEELIYVGP